MKRAAAALAVFVLIGALLAAVSTPVRAEPARALDDYGQLTDPALQARFLEPQVRRNIVFAGKPLLETGAHHRFVASEVADRAHAEGTDEL